MKYRVTNIEYDLTDSFGEIGADDGISLPKNLIVVCDSEDEIADTISDFTDFCVKSFVIEK